MTNGEKIQTILNVDRDCIEVHGENGTMTFTVTQDWWNSEYKEPTTKNDEVIEGCECFTCKYGDWKRKGWSLDMADDKCGGCCSWSNKYEPLEQITKNDHHKQNIQAYAHDFGVSEEQAEKELLVTTKNTGYLSLYVFDNKLQCVCPL